MNCPLWLYSICQRYNFESNLQHNIDTPQNNCSCIRYVKDTILKAIYNAKHYLPVRQKAVFDMSKIQFWKQFTTVWLTKNTTNMLYSICQRYNFESNLQHVYGRIKTILCCIRYVKDTILKAIYNSFYGNRLLLCAVFDMSKIQFWKQFTTRDLLQENRVKLYSICQRYNFESNLQHIRIWIISLFCCIRYVKDTILKAIYNAREYGILSSFAVFDMSKIQFWKQFTTYICASQWHISLYSICQRYNFESNLQQGKHSD